MRASTEENSYRAWLTRGSRDELGLIINTYTLTITHYVIYTLIRLTPVAFLPSPAGRSFFALRAAIHVNAYPLIDQ